MKALVVILFCIWMVADLKQFFVAGALLECNEKSLDARRALMRKSASSMGAAVPIDINTRAWPLKKEVFVGHAYSGLVDCQTNDLEQGVMERLIVFLAVLFHHLKSAI